MKTYVIYSISRRDHPPCEVKVMFLGISLVKSRDEESAFLYAKSQYPTFEVAVGLFNPENPYDAKLLPHNPNPPLRRLPSHQGEDAGRAARPSLSGPRKRFLRQDR